MSLVTIRVDKTGEFINVLVPDFANRNVAYLVRSSDHLLGPALLEYMHNLVFIVVGAILTFLLGAPDEVY